MIAEVLASLLILVGTSYYFLRRKRAGQTTQPVEPDQPTFDFKENGTRVAIVGSGVGGISAAYELSQLFKNNSKQGRSACSITVFEKESYIGGRCKVIKFHGNTHEAGGAIISDLNETFKRYMDLSGSARHDHYETPSTVAITGKHGFSYNSPLSIPDSFLGIPLSLKTRLRISNILAPVSLVRLFGLAKVLRMKKVLKARISELSFDALYTALAKGSAYERATDMINTIHPSIVGMMKQTAYEVTMDEIVESQHDPLCSFINSNMRCNYGGQDLHSLHGFVGMVSIAGGISSKCFAVDNGNVTVFQNLLKMAEVNDLHLNTEVKCIRKLDHGVEVTYESGNKEAQEIFDVVMVCTPLPRTKNLKLEINLVADEKIETLRNRSYRRCVTTFVYGEINQTYFQGDGYDPKKTLPLTTILTDATSTLPIYSIGVNPPAHLNTPAKGRDYIMNCLAENSGRAVYKIFSPAMLTSSQLEDMFTWYEKSSVQVEDWYAYPDYKIPQPHSDFVFEKSDSSLVLYGNAIEEWAGAMEMSCISGHNLANVAWRWACRNKATLVEK